MLQPMSRRAFLARTTALPAAAVISPLAAWAAEENGKKMPDFIAMREDPVRKMFPAEPDLDRILSLYPRVVSEPAFDPTAIAERAAALKTTPEVRTGHPFLDLSVKVGLAHIDSTFVGDRPRYGVKFYGKGMHDAFPPTIVATVDALSAWGLNVRAAQLFRYWLTHYVRPDGTIEYKQLGVDGASLSEFGQLLHTAALLEERAGADGWWTEGFKPLDALAGHLLSLAAATKGDGILFGVSEADWARKPGKFFHNNAWVAKGLRRWADLCERRKASPATAPDGMRKAADKIAADTLAAINKTWPADLKDWWLPPCVEPMAHPQWASQNAEASYTNYRFWPELLSSDLLPAAMANRMIEARLKNGGQFCGMTRFLDHLDDWPLADYLYGLWSLGRKNDFLLSLYGHVAYHQAEGHLTAYEQVTFPPGREKAAYCLPCQLVAARAARLLVK